MRLVKAEAVRLDMRLVTAQAVGHAFGLFLVREHAFGHEIKRGHAFGPSQLRGHAVGLLPPVRTAFRLLPLKKIRAPNIIFPKRSGLRRCHRQQSLAKRAPRCGDWRYADWKAMRGIVSTASHSPWLLRGSYARWPSHRRSLQSRSTGSVGVRMSLRVLDTHNTWLLASPTVPRFKRMKISSQVW